MYIKNSRQKEKTGVNNVITILYLLLLKMGPYKLELYSCAHLDSRIFSMG